MTIGGNMLTFNEKLNIIDSFTELTRVDISLGRVNFHYEESVKDKKIVVYRLHPNGNGFVYAGDMKDLYETDVKGMVNIRDFTEETLRKIIRDSIDSLSEQEPIEEIWIDKHGNELILKNDFDSWNVYVADLLEATFATYDAARDYLEQEEFQWKH